MKRLRLMNVGQVLVRQGEQTIELRPQCVELKSDRDGVTNVLMLSLYEKQFKNTDPNPIIVAKFELTGEVQIVDAAVNDGVTFIVQADNMLMLVRPLDKEYIWVDRGYTVMSDITDDPAARQLLEPLASLFEQQRACMMSLVVYERFFRTATSESARHMHGVNVMVARQAIRSLEMKIARKEAQLGRTH